MTNQSLKQRINFSRDESGMGPVLFVYVEPGMPGRD